MKIDAPQNFINRELSWLDFNMRVLAEAESSSVPLMERLKFLAIASSNLDEFFMVRVAITHRALLKRAAYTGPDQMPPKDILKEIRKKVLHMVKRQYDCFDKVLMPNMENNGITVIRGTDYTAEDMEFAKLYFNERLLPVLTPMAVDTGHPFPLLANATEYILFKIKPHEDTAGRLWSQTDTVLVQVPPVLSRFIKLPSKNDEDRFALIDDIICFFAGELLGGGYKIEGAYPFRITRDAEFSVDDEATEDLMTAIEEELRTRKWGRPIRLEVGSDVNDDIANYLCEQLNVSEDEVYRIPSIINLKSLFGLLGMVDRPPLSDKPWPPCRHPGFVDEADIFQTIRKGDIILHHPYHSFDPVVNFISTAADDPNVLAIKITLYRVSGGSPVVAALIRAAENGKQVTALVELRARFDEEANITWAKRLDRAGAHVIYGVVGYKTHSKVCLVVRREEDGIQRYVHLSTGNYNDKTAKLYTDIGMFTARAAFGSDISSFFNVITGYSLPPSWKRIEMAPTGLRNKVIALIEREVEKHTPETPGFIRAKMNSLIDKKVIESLYRASRTGVRIELVVRGMCRLRAGVKGLSENISVISILDRFLEHPRIYHFYNGGNEEIYLSSADWMERNFDRRLELFFPVIDPEKQKEVLHILDTALADNIKAWIMNKDGSYSRVIRKRNTRSVRSQEKLYLEAAESVEKSRKEKACTFTARTSDG